MKKIQSSLFAFLVFAGLLGSADAKVKPMSLQERVKASDVILIGEIIKSYTTGIVEEAGVQNWIAECRVAEVLKGRVDETDIRIKFIQIPLQNPKPIMLMEHKKYLLFLKDRYELIDPYSGSLVLEGNLWLYDDDVAPDYSQDQEMTSEETIARIKDIVNKQPIQQFDKSSPLTLTIKADKKIYQVGETPIIRVNLENLSQKGLAVRYYYAEFSNSGWKVNDLTNIPSNLGSGKSTTKILNIGERTTATIYLELVPDRPGKYVISFSNRVWVGDPMPDTADYKEYFLSSNVITIEVVKKE